MNSWLPSRHCRVLSSYMDPGPPQLPSPTDSRPPRHVPAKSHDTPACAGYRPGTPQEASGTPSKGYTIRLVNAIPASFVSPGPLDCSAAVPCRGMRTTAYTTACGPRSLGG